MSNKRLTAVWDHSIQKGTKLLALLSLADRADDDGYCWPSHKDTAERTRSARTYVHQILPEIEQDGELYTHKRAGKSSRYLVIVGMTPDAIKAAMVRRFEMSEAEAAAKVSEILTCQYSRHVSTADMSGDDVSVQQTTHVSSTEHEPKRTHKKNINPQEGQTNGNYHVDPPSKPPKEPTPAQAMFQALADVCGYDPKKLTDPVRGILNANEKELRKAGYSAEFVRDTFGPWWYRTDFRGQKKQKPTPSQVVTEIGKVPVDNFDDYETDLERRRVEARRALESIHEATHA